MPDQSRIANGFHFGRFSFDADTGELYRDEAFVTRLARQPHQVLETLLKAAPNLIYKKALMDMLWEDKAKQDESALRGILKTLRNYLQDDRDRPEYIETITGRGYRFLQSVVPLPLTASVEKSPAPSLPESSGEAVAPGQERIVLSSIALDTLGETHAPPMLSVSSPSQVESPVTGSAAVDPIVQLLRNLWVATVASILRLRNLWIAAVAVVIVFAAVLGVKFWLSGESSQSRSAQPSPAIASGIAITSPTPDAPVDWQNEVIVSDLNGKAASMCIVIHPKIQGEPYHIQRGVQYDESTKSWTVMGYFGVQGQMDTGSLFEIRAIAGCEMPSGLEVSSWPEGVDNSKIVTVKRR